MGLEVNTDSNEIFHFDPITDDAQVKFLTNKTQLPAKHKVL